MAILFNPATPIVREALKRQSGGAGPWTDTIELINSYLWACFVALGGGEMVMIDADLLRPIDSLKEECELLIRKASNWEKKGGGIVNPTSARFSLIHTYRILLDFGFVKAPEVVKETVLIDLDVLVAQ